MVMSFLVKRPEGEGLIQVVERRKMKYESFALLKGKSEEAFSLPASDEEKAMVLLSGRFEANVGSKVFVTGYRKDVFSSNAWAIYVPPGIEASVKMLLPSEIAIAVAPATNQGEAFMVTPDDVRAKSAGVWNWRRDVKDIIDGRHKVEKLIIGETINAPGNWSGWPPHKHDTENFPIEVVMEEIYHFRIKPQGGFGIQRIYDGKELDELYVINDGDTVMLPKGYHPVVAAPGYSLYYLWILSGETRFMAPYEDPAHVWQRGAEAVINEVLR